MISDIEIYGGNARVVAQLKTLLTTPIGTVAMDRSFGVDMSILDLPETQVRPRISVEFRTKISQYMPEIEVREISFASGGEGKIIPRVVIG